jgi:hypothetical protein
LASEHFGRHLDVGELIHDAEKKMETLIFALIASYNAHRQQEPAVAEPEEFQPFDLQALRNSVDTKPTLFRPFAKRAGPMLKKSRRVLVQTNESAAAF